MDDEEVDIGTVRNLEASSWIPPRLQVESALLLKPPFRGLASPSAPNITEDPHSSQPEDLHSSQSQNGATLTRIKTLPHLRHKSGALSDPDLPTVNVGNLAKIRRWILGVAVGK